MDKDVSAQINKYKRINSRNTIVIIILAIVLALVCALAIYIRFFG